jgi:beta-glucanase (GH16 family)
MSIDPNNPTATAHLTFDDEFNSLSLSTGTAGSGTWLTTYPFYSVTGNGGTLTSNNEQEWYINSNYGPTSSVKPWTVNNGILNITAAPASSTISPLINNYKYTSGELNTYQSFSQTYGLFEMSAKLPAGQGLWPAFWLMPQDGSWPPELDIMEQLGQNPSTYYTTVHSNTLSGGYSSGADNVANTSTGFHTYAVDWEPDYCTFYFDGAQVYKTPTPSDMNKPMYMILNLAVGGNWPGSPNSTTPFPANMQVDWVKVYASGATGGTTPPPSGGTTTPPPSGGTTTPPPSGGTTTPPPSGGTTTPPPSGGTTTPPPSGGTTTPPPTGGSTTPPPSGGNTGGSTTPPPSGGTTTPPPSGGTTTPPPTGGTTTPPPSGGTTTPPPSGGTAGADYMTKSGAATTLANSSGWTDAKMLSNGQLAIARATDGGWGSHTAAADLYNPATGAQIGSQIKLSGYTAAGVTMSPQISALGSGYFKVNYAGAGASNGTEYYTPSGKQALLVNQYTQGSPVLTPLKGGGAVTTNPAWTSFSDTSASGAVSWFNDAMVNGKATAPSQVAALNGGGFAFSYAGSSQLDFYNAGGAHVSTAALGAANSSYAMATAGLSNGNLAAAWLSPSSSGTTLTYESFDSTGKAVTSAINVAADADPSHTQMAIVPSAASSGQAMLLWSQGGSVYGAGVNGSTVGTATKLFAGSLSQTTQTALSDGKVAMTWVQSVSGVNHVMADVIDPTTMTAVQHDLGAGSGGASLVATANGGFAVSWHNGSAIQASGYDGAGHYGTATAVSGDFVGVDSTGSVAAIGHDSSGSAILQHYLLGVDPLTGH